MPEERLLEILISYEEPYQFVVWIGGKARKKFDTLADAISYCSVAGLDVVIKAHALEKNERLTAKPEGSELKGLKRSEFQRT